MITHNPAAFHCSLLHHGRLAVGAICKAYKASLLLTRALLSTIDCKQCKREGLAYLLEPSHEPDDKLRNRKERACLGAVSRNMHGFLQDGGACYCL